MRLFLSCFLFLSVFNVFSQESATSEIAPKVKIDSLYREDQFYFGLTYNSLTNTPAGYSNKKFSGGFSGGFLRDMPINKKRTFAIAPGLGFSYNAYNQNIAITGSGQAPTYTIIPDSEKYSKNKFSQLFVDVPVEFRWRSSTYESHKFWRIYTGFKLSYLVFDKSTYNSTLGNSKISNNKDFNDFTYGAYISSGYNTVNVYVYYGLNPLFKSAKISEEDLKVNSFNLGIMFYIL